MLDPISDMLTRIRNAQLAKKSAVSMPSSKMKKSVADILVARGFVEAVRETSEDGKKTLTLDLRYRDGGFSEKIPVISEIRRVSKEGQRVYVKSSDIHRIKNGLGVAIVSTPQGVMAGDEARRRKLGGEYICLVW
jgi:small subunit ribosomal protein S8